MRCTSLYKYETKKQQCNNNNGILLDGILFEINTKKYYSIKVLFVSQLLRNKYILLMELYLHQKQKKWLKCTIVWSRM